MAASAEGFIEATVFSLIFIAAFTVVVVNMNVTYPSNFTVDFDDNSNAEQLFIDYEERAQSQIQGSEVQFDAEQGITVKSSWGLAKDAVIITWGFLTGGWIENVVGHMHLGTAGTALARGLRVIYIIALIFALLFILFKVIF